MIIDPKKDRTFPVLSAVLLAICLILCIGLFTFLHACVHEDGSFGTCHWAQMALRLFAVSMTVCALLALLSPKKVRLGLNLSLIVQGIMAFLLPGRVIPLCMMKTMHCQAVMRPGVMLLSAVTVVLAAVQVLTERRG